MTISNIIEMIILICSVPAAIYMVASSNRKVKDIDGLGDVVKEEGQKGVVVAHF